MPSPTSWSWRPPRSSPTSSSTPTGAPEESCAARSVSRQSGNYLALVWPQLAIIALTASALCYGLYAFVFESRGSLASLSVNAFWSAYNIAMLAPIVRAAVFRPPEGWKPRPPAFLLARS
jgi:hypothetical protein